MNQTTVELSSRGQSALRREGLDLGVERASCPLCRSSETEATSYSQRPFAVVRCVSCRLWFLSPRVPEGTMRALYQGDAYFAGVGAGYFDYGRQERSLRRTYRRLLRHLAAADITGGDLLEIGAGHGFFLSEAEPYFRRRVGTEMSAAAAAQATPRADAVHLGSIDAVPEGERFDCIAAFHVIEHVYAPVEFVGALAARLRGNGTLVLAAPDMGGFWRKLMGPNWPSFKYPEHVAFYDSTTMRLLLTKAGFGSALRISYIHDFPLSEIMAKLGLGRINARFDCSLPLPSTTVCYAVRASSR